MICLFQQLTGLALEQLSPAKLANLLLMKAPNNDWSWRPNLTQMCHFNVAAILVRDHASLHVVYYRNAII